MKIDKRKCPILFEPISFKDLGLSNYITSGNEIPDDIARGNEKVLSECLSNIMYITHPVVEAFDYGDEKTILKLLSLRNEIQTVPYIERSPYIGYWGHYTCVCISFFIWVVVVNIK